MISLVQEQKKYICPKCGGIYNAGMIFAINKNGFRCVYCYTYLANGRDDLVR